MSLESAIEAQTEAIRASNVILQVLASHITGLMIGKAPERVEGIPAALGMAYGATETAAPAETETAAPVPEVKETKPEETKAAKTEPKEEKADVKPTPETPEVKTYEELRERVTPLLKMAEPGKKAFAALLEKYSVTHAKQLEPAQYTAFVKDVEAKFAELKAV